MRDVMGISDPRARRIRRLLVLAAVPLALAQLAADCVDGTTPDCSGPEAGCGPNLDATTDVSSIVPEGGRDAPGADAPEAGSDADPDADAGD
jgi:hypothetical protein